MIKPMEDEILLNTLNEVKSDTFTVKIYNLQFSSVNNRPDKRIDDLQAKYPSNKRISVEMSKNDISNDVQSFYSKVMDKVIEKMVKKNHFPFVVDGFEIAKVI